jgi:hypothetical protein
VIVIGNSSLIKLLTEILSITIGINLWLEQLISQPNVNVSSDGSFYYKMGIKNMGNINRDITSTITVRRGGLVVSIVA